MKAEFPHDLPDNYDVIGLVVLREYSQCAMLRLEKQCPDLTAWGMLYARPDKVQCVLPMCDMCAAEVNDWLVNNEHA